MGSYSPVPWVTREMLGRITDEIIVPVVTELARRGTPYSGILYASVIWTADGPYVIEFNCRFGDPEAQVLLPRLQSDPFALMRLIATGESIRGMELRWAEEGLVCVVVAREGYPDGSPAPLPVPERLLRAPLGVTVLHAGTTMGPDGVVMSNGGRVLNVIGRRDEVYQFLGDKPQGYRWRSDIALAA